MGIEVEKIEVIDFVNDTFHYKIHVRVGDINVMYTGSADIDRTEKIRKDMDDAVKYARKALIDTVDVLARLKAVGVKTMRRDILVKLLYRVFERNWLKLTSMPTFKDEIIDVDRAIEMFKSMASG